MCISSAYYTHPEHLDHAPDPEDVSTKYAMTFIHGEDENGIIVYLIRGFWNNETDEFWDGSIYLLDEDGTEHEVDMPTDELWFAADKAMKTKTYEDLDEIE